jgi:hypothetical protein
MKIKEVKEIPSDKKEVTPKSVSSDEGKEEKKKLEKKESEIKKGSEEEEREEESEEDLEIEQFRDGGTRLFSPGALALLPEENNWQPRSLEESLALVPNKIEENERSNLGDFYKTSSSGGVYNNGSGSDLYKGSGGSSLYTESSEEARMLYSPFERADDEGFREPGQDKISKLEVEGINKRFGKSRRDEDKKKYYP